MIVFLCLVYVTFMQYQTGSLAKAAGAGFLALVSLFWLMFLAISAIEKWEKLSSEERFWCVIWLIIGVGT